MLGGEKNQVRVAEALASGVRDFAEKVLVRRLVAQVKPQPGNGDALPVNAATVVASPGGTR
jgi:hypothetical protein